ncbi:response regulator [Candidatus Nomurabacteria bacterium]|nr:response regulator [Candidatus Nomurabacteria bacterium]MCB9827486.1 response regulator [Candidatus Nomurabacteria bacterium]HXK52515.1 response regulator [bacterium]
MAKIILIEDEQALSEVYSEVLRDAGYEVSQCFDGEEGLKTLRAGSWDLLLLDLMLPKIDGIEILQQLVNEGLLEGRSVIMLTNLGSDELVNKCSVLGAKEFLIKSDIDPKVLVEAVGKALSK